ncbi:MAG: hypothetical protein U0793_16565 [Gemmataceae bacterium]
MPHHVKPMLACLSTRRSTTQLGVRGQGDGYRAIAEVEKGRSVSTAASSLDSTS